MNKKKFDLLTKVNTDLMREIKLAGDWRMKEGLYLYRIVVPSGLMKLCHAFVAGAALHNIGSGALRLRITKRSPPVAAEYK